jgi:cobalt-zinc-cadmium efflux system membrane fusion protein
MKPIFIFIILAGGLVACDKANRDAALPPAVEQPEDIVTMSEAQLASAQIELGRVTETEISTKLKVNGVVDVPPQNLVSISMPLGGYLRSTHLLPGKFVKKGEIIATMEDPQYIQIQEDYLVTKSNLDYAEAEYKRQKELFEMKSTSEKIFQQARMEYDNQKISLSALEEKMKLIHIDPVSLNEKNMSSRINLYAPIHGYVSAVKVNIGRYVAATDVLFELINPEDIHLNLRVFEKDIDRLSLGQPVTAYTLHQPDKKYECEVMLISQVLSEDRTAEVHCHFEKYDKQLLPGMYMNAEIGITNQHVYAIPEEAVVQFEGRNFLFLAVSKNTFQMVPAETGIMEKGLVEIKNGDKYSGTEVVTKGAYTLLMELKNKSEG